MPEKQERKQEPVPSETPQVLVSRFQQMFPILTPAEIDRARRFGELRRFQDGEILCQVGRTGPGMYVILSGRVAVAAGDGLGRAFPAAAMAQMIGVNVHEMEEVVPGEVLAELGQLSGKPSVINAQAKGEVEAIVVSPEGLRTLLVAEAELGERILRALILRRGGLIETGFGGPLLLRQLRSPAVRKLAAFLGRNGIPFRVIEPDDDAEASAVVARLAPEPEELPIVVLPAGEVLK